MGRGGFNSFKENMPDKKEPIFVDDSPQMPSWYYDCTDPRSPWYTEPREDGTIHPGDWIMQHHIWK